MEFLVHLAHQIRKRDGLANPSAFQEPLQLDHLREEHRVLQPVAGPGIDLHHYLGRPGEVLVHQVNDLDHRVVPPKHLLV